MALLTSASIALLAIAPHAGEAQIVRGTVVSADGTAPVAGAVVLLRDSAGTVVTRGLSNAAGEFLLAATSAGTYDLRILRIGYRPSIVPPFSLGADETRVVKARLNGTAIRLAGIQVTSTAECEVRPDSSQAAFAVWEAARTALMAVLLTRRSPPSVRLRRYTRMLDAAGKRVVREQVREERRVSDRPFVSLPADTLLSRGFVQSDSAGTVYNAPDADVLLAERFADTHCLRLASASSSDSTRIGLQFAPVRSRERVSDITGILWLDRATARLESLEYGYTNLPRSLEDARPSGRVSFLQLATGGWVVGGWEIRMPQVQLRDQSTFQGSGLSNMQGGRVERRRIAEVTGIQVEGGDILEVSQEGVSVWAKRSGSVRLNFRDAVTREPVRQVRGTVAGTKVSFVSDSGGGATLPAMPPGEYSLNLHTAFQDSLHLEPFSARLIVLGDSISSVELTLPARNTVLRGACGVDLEERKEAVIIGTVVDSNGTAWSGALVLALWQAQPTFTGNDISVRTEQRSTQADSKGYFRVCGVPQGRSAQLFVGQQTRSARSHTVSVPIGRTVVEVQLRSTR